MKLEEFKKGESYNQEILDETTSYDELDDTSEVTQETFGQNHLGENFVLIKDYANCAVSFVLIGYSKSSENVYECIYTDF